MTSTFFQLSAPPSTSSAGLSFIVLRSKYLRSSTIWYGQVRHSKRFRPAYLSSSGVQCARGMEEMMSMLLQEGQTEGERERVLKGERSGFW